MKKLIWATIIIAIQHLTFSIQHSFAQAANDNIGSGNCLDFDGVDDYVLIPDNDQLSFTSTTSKFTISFWIQPAVAGVQNIIGKYNSSNGGIEYLVQRNGGGLNFSMSNDGSSGNLAVWNAPAVNMPLDQWTQLTVVVDIAATNVDIYENGIEVASSLIHGTFPGSLSNLTEPFRIGTTMCAMGSLCNFFDGQMDEVRVWNKALTPSEVRNNMCQNLEGNEAGLVGYWNMNEGVGGTIADLTTNGNNGTLQ